MGVMWGGCGVTGGHVGVTWGAQGSHGGWGARGERSRGGLWRVMWGWGAREGHVGVTWGLGVTWGKVTWEKVTRV